MFFYLSCLSLLLALSLVEGGANFFLSPNGDLSLSLSASGSRRSFNGLLSGEVLKSEIKLWKNYNRNNYTIDRHASFKC